MHAHDLQRWGPFWGVGGWGQLSLLQGVSYLFFLIQFLKKHTLNPEITLLYKFHAQKALFKIPKICNINFWIENPSPPLEFLQKFIRFGGAIRR